MPMLSSLATISVNKDGKDGNAATPLSSASLFTYGHISSRPRDNRFMARRMEAIVARLAAATSSSRGNRAMADARPAVRENAAAKGDSAGGANKAEGSDRLSTTSTSMSSPTSTSSEDELWREVEYLSLEHDLASPRASPSVSAKKVHWNASVSSSTPAPLSTARTPSISADLFAGPSSANAAASGATTQYSHRRAEPRFVWVVLRGNKLGVYHCQ
ncbi:uncharacterized protein PHACADRAFT_33495 [Phanerochaete carnosa HHB-10118-sp]|uniref:Uncharacterized protein n=1 Tax=Phanerochaete carnosa (strain HHB-10118-sp) TaxID=650164 RepID=K5VSB2_PHACS|nr:uncharacterized protein PHACADRAFT_33495 [Phanerochaete carnosa HHB-10118-sp]EKM49454.1 hypothetical protein PHACADRAFT_33495 [Phanerochaete carnosa HHB-10118-sp]